MVRNLQKKFFEWFVDPFSYRPGIYNCISTLYPLIFGYILAKDFTQNILLYHSSLCIIAILVSSDTKLMKNAF